MLHAFMPRQLTIRGVPDEVSRRLARLSKERGESMNATVLSILVETLGVDARRARLERYATWTNEDREAFDRAVAAQRVVDDQLWR
jgi:plasmid stability protein